MKKKIFAVLFVAVVAMFAGYNVYQSQSVVNLSDLALSNVEALAESPEDYTKRTGCIAIIEEDTCVDFDGKKHKNSTEDDRE